MEKQFLFIDYETRNIEGRDFVVIYLLEINKKQVFKIYKIQNGQLIGKIDNFKKFQDITNLIDFVIKRDNKISLDIKI